MHRVIAAFGTLAALTFPGLSAGPALASPANGLLAHRAIYDLELSDASERSGIRGMDGRMVYEFNGSPCDGYTVSFRFVTRIDTSDGTRVTDQQTTTYEDLEARTFKFKTRSFVDDEFEREISGQASESGEGIEVDLEEPEQKELDFADAFFPTAHMLDLIEHARKGDTIVESRIFDGSEDGDKAMLTTSILGRLKTPTASDEEAKAAGELASEPYWPVSMAYFNETGNGDELPDYRISFKLYDNGVTRDLTMDYGEFVLQGNLAKLEIFDAPKCD